MKRNALRHLLPEVFQRTLRPGNPLTALLEVMEKLHEPSERILQNLSAVFDPRCTPDGFVPFLAHWVDLGWLFEDFRDKRRSPKSLHAPFTPGLGRLRESVAAATYLAHWRGTAKGLLLFLQTATGTRGFEIDEHVIGPDGRPKPYHIRILAPKSTARHRALIERIIEFEKPAHVTYELEFGPEPQPAKQAQPKQDSRPRSHLSRVPDVHGGRAGVLSD